MHSHEIEVNPNGEKAQVISVNENFVEVRMLKIASCSTCAASGFCHGTDKPVVHRIKTDLKLDVNDIVEVYIGPETRIVTSFLIFIVPILMLIGFYFLGIKAFNFSEGYAILMSFVGLILSAIIIKLIDKAYESKLRFKIVRKINEN